MNHIPVLIDRTLKVDYSTTIYESLHGHAVIMASNDSKAYQLSLFNRAGRRVESVIRFNKDSAILEANIWDVYIQRTHQS